MHINEQTLTRFYSAFAQLDADTMAQCYADDATFEDPVFTLKGKTDVGGMWKMLCDATKSKGRQDWRLEFSDVSADGTEGHAHWEAHYRFSVTKRLVHNVIEANFTFTPDGLIASHKDTFDFWRWSRQTLGLAGYMLGWMPFFRTQMRERARQSLDKYLDGKTLGSDRSDARNPD